MDVHGTRFHLLSGAADWQRCLTASPLDPTLGPAVWSASGVTLEALPPRLAAVAGPGAANPSARRGAARDRYGNAYWIARDAASLWWQPSGSEPPSRWWDASTPAGAVAAGAFGAPASDPATAAAPRLAGLAVTAHHQLVCADCARRALLVFDLWGGGAPLVYRWPAQLKFTPFAPFAIAAAVDGGVWILDQKERSVWRIDRQFAWPLHSKPCTDSTFHSAGKAPAGRARPSPAPPPPLPAARPMALLALPDGSLLLICAPPAAPGRVLQQRDGKIVADLPLSVRVATWQDSGNGSASGASDLDLTPESAALVVGERDEYTRLYVVEAGGRQAFAFDLAFKDGQLQTATPTADYLPLHSWGARGLLGAGGEVFYDVARGGDAADDAAAWTPLVAIERPRYAHDNAVFIATPLDGKLAGCVWHRLLIDACIPPETSVTVHSRAADDLDLLEASPWREEPGLYLRGQGAELPWFDPWPGRPRPLPEGCGSWEMLFENARGRWLQLVLTLHGNGRVSPRLVNLRAWYPRFSYPERFLPAVYRQDPPAAAFLERLLANPEGINTEIEGRIASVSALFDARTAPPETLDWLGTWLAIALDPLWPLLHRDADPAAPDRRRLLIRFALRLYERRGTADALLLSLHLLLDPCLEALLRRLQAASVREDSALRVRLAALELPYPQRGADDASFEDLLCAWIVSPRRASRLRIVEHFRTRAAGRAAAGDLAAPARAADNEALAHRFSVLLPGELPDELVAMAERIVRLEMPAHTRFDLRRYGDFFRVGAARLGIDTVLGEESRYAPLILNRNALAAAYLSARHPFDLPERFVPGRDRLGSAAPL